jgi:hypothetical protein
MSEEGETFWVSISEKFFGLLLTIVSALLLYFTFSSIDVFGAFTALFGFLGFVLLAIGLFLLVVKPPE